MGVNVEQGRQRLYAAYGPDLIEEYVHRHLPRMYSGTAPTLEAAARIYGEQALEEWLSDLYGGMAQFAGGAEKLTKGVLGRCVKMTRISFGSIKLTEMMHFSHLYASGAFGKSFGSPDGQGIMAALRRYFQCERVEYLNKYCPESRAADADSFSADDCRGLSTRFSETVTKILTPSNMAVWGEWRSEPWAKPMARAFFEDKSLSTFPGDMPYNARRSWAAANGFAEEELKAWDRRREQ